MFYSFGGILADYTFSCQGSAGAHFDEPWYIMSLIPERWVVGLWLPDKQTSPNVVPNDIEAKGKQPFMYVTGSPTWVGSWFRFGPGTRLRVDIDRWMTYNRKSTLFSTSITFKYRLYVKPAAGTESLLVVFKDNKTLKFFVNDSEQIVVKKSTPGGDVTIFTSSSVVLNEGSVANLMLGVVYNDIVPEQSSIFMGSNVLSEGIMFNSKSNTS